MRQAQAERLYDQARRSSGIPFMQRPLVQDPRWPNYPDEWVVRLTGGREVWTEAEYAAAMLSLRQSA